MLARMPTRIDGIARVAIGLACLIVVQALGQNSVAPQPAVAQQAPPPVVINPVVPNRLIRPTVSRPNQAVRAAPPVVMAEPLANNPSIQGALEPEQGYVRPAAPLQLETPPPEPARASPVGASNPPAATSSIAHDVIVEPVPNFSLSAPGQPLPVVRPAMPMTFVLPDPARTRTRSIEVLQLSDVTRPTPQSTVVPAKPPKETMEFLRLSDPAWMLAPAITPDGPRPEGSGSVLAVDDDLLRLSDPNRDRSSGQTTRRNMLPNYVLQPTPPNTTTTDESQTSEQERTAGALLFDEPAGIGIDDIGLSETPKAVEPSGKPAMSTEIADQATPATPENLLRLSDAAVDAKQDSPLVEEHQPPNVLRPPVAVNETTPPAAAGELPEPKPNAAEVEGIAEGTPQVDKFSELELADSATRQKRSLEQQVRPPEVIPPGFEPWWQEEAMRQLRESPKAVNVNVNSLIVDALRYSAQVQAISDEAIIAQTSITRAAAEFDTEAFMESRLVRTDVPTGSQLEAGAAQTRLRELDWQYSAGLRKKNEYGGRFEVAQRIGTKNSTSQFFTPQRQGNARLTLSYNQPLLNGGGEVYNSSLILMAKVDSTVAIDRTSSQLQDQLLEVTESMWELYVQRSLMLQKRRHLERATAIYSRLVRRRGIDVLESQIARAGAAVATRRTELIRAETAIRNAEAYLRSLVNSPELLSDRSSELIPIQAPASYFVPVDLHDALATALNNRPDVDAAAQEIEAARVRLKVARNELLPVLDAVLETYVSGIRGGYNIGTAWTDQFEVGKPSYSAGLVFENPIGRRSAKANHLRRKIELRQLSNKFKATVESLNADVEVAVREVETAFREMQAMYQSMVAAKSDADYLLRRWETLPGDDRSASFMLEDLLDAQDRLASAEFEFTRAQVAYTLSLTYLNRATGTLLKQEKIKMVQGADCGLPTIRFEKADEDSEAPAPNVADGARPLQDPSPVGRRQ